MTKKPFNILLLNETSSLAGAETVVYNIARYLDRNRFSPRVVLFKPGRLYKFLSENGITVDIIHSKQSWDLPFLVNLIRYCRQNKIDLIHAHLPGANLYGSIAGKILGIPVICTFHNEFILPGAIERFGRIKMFLIRNLASRLVVVAEYMKQEYFAKGKFPAKKMITILNGVSCDEPQGNFDSEKFKMEIDFRDGEFLIASVANFRPPKGHEILVEAANRVCHVIPEAKFLLIGDDGDGKIKRRTVELIEKHNLQNQIKLLGYRNDISQILRNIDIFLLASISEGLPLSVVEGMMASRPVIATNVGGLSEVVKNGETGFLVEPSDPGALAEKTIILLRDQKLRIMMGKKGRKHAESLFSLENMINKYQDLYAELLT